MKKIAAPQVHGIATTCGILLVGRVILVARPFGVERIVSLIPREMTGMCDLHKLESEDREQDDKHENELKRNRCDPAHRGLSDLSISA